MVIELKVSDSSRRVATSRDFIPTHHITKRPMIGNLHGFQNQMTLMSIARPVPKISIRRR